jgi:hypothetical protein
MPETDGTYTIAVLGKLRLHPRVTYTLVNDPAPQLLVWVQELLRLTN